MENLEIRVGLNAITQYRRLDYTAWHAIAEFVDNSTQSFFNNREALSAAFAEEGEGLRVDISYDREPVPILRIADNAMGMSYDDLAYALHLAQPPQNAAGRSRYGLGMKTAACWVGNRWTIITKKLGETNEYSVTIDVNKIADGDQKLPTRVRPNVPADQHYTIVEVTDHNKEFRGRTLGKIKDHLRSMYRQDFRSDDLKLTWRGEELHWDDLGDRILKDRTGRPYRINFDYEIDGHTVRGWAGVLERGSRSDAGFSIMQANRVVRGWPSAWRPESIFGDARNDLINQRLVGEVHLDGFEVTHTKDNIQWHGDQEERVEKELRDSIQVLITVARERRSRDNQQGGPTEAEIDAATSALREELNSPEIVDQIEIDDMPDDNTLKEGTKKLVEQIRQGHEPQIVAQIGDTRITVYLISSMSVNDPYFSLDGIDELNPSMVINLNHPHLCMVDGQMGALNYFRHCIYDALASHKARHKRGQITWDTVLSLKDRLLRASMTMEEEAASDMDEED